MIAYNLEQALPQANTVQELHLVGRGLRSLSPEILRCQNLRKIVLRGNQLSTLPGWLQELPLLEELDVSNNPLSSWPTHLGETLLTLSVEKTALVLGPDTLLSFPKLLHLKVAGCRLAGKASALFLPRSLQSLVLRNLRAKKLPMGLSRLEGLERLDASENLLSTFPEGLPANLKHLDLSNNRMYKGSLPGKFYRLESLNLSGNRFAEVPNGIWEHTPSLQNLLLANNRIDRLPEKTPSFTRLRNLDLGKNRLTDLPAELSHCQHIKTVNLQRNAFAQLPTVLFAWRRLDQLDLSRNQLEKLQGDWLQLAQLRGLVLDKNPLQQLPDRIFQMARLQSLSLKGIKVKPTPKQILASPALDKVLPQRGLTPVLDFNRLLRKDKVPAAQRDNCWRLRSGDSPSYDWALVRIGLSSSDALLRKKTRAWMLQHADQVVLEPGKRLLPLGNTGFLREEWSAQLKPFVRCRMVDEPIDAILLGPGRIPLEQLPLRPTAICWPSEVQAWLDGQTLGLAYSQDRLSKLEQLLRSRIAADVDLALGIVRVHGLPPRLRSSFLLALEQHRGSSLGRRLRSFAQRYPDQEG